MENDVAVVFKVLGELRMDSLKINVCVIGTDAGIQKAFATRSVYKSSRAELSPRAPNLDLPTEHERGLVAQLLCQIRMAAGVAHDRVQELRSVSGRLPNQREPFFKLARFFASEIGQLDTMTNIERCRVWTLG